MIKKIIAILIVFTMLSTSVYAEEVNNVEVFDINKGKVIKIIKSDSKLQSLAIKYLKEISGVYAKMNPIPKEGYAIRIPLNTPEKIQSEWLSALVEEVILMYPSDNSTPFLMVFDNSERLMCFTFTENSENILKKLKLK